MCVRTKWVELCVIALLIQECGFGYSLPNIKWKGQLCRFVCVCVCVRVKEAFLFESLTSLWNLLCVR